MVTYIVDVQYEHGISEAFDNTKVIFKELEGFNHNGNIVAILNNEAKNSKTDTGKSMGFLTQVLASILNDYEVPADSLVSRLKEWFDEVTYNKVEK